MYIEGKNLPKNSQFVNNKMMSLDKIYVQALKYSEIMKPLSDAQLLKMVLNVGYSYLKLVKKLVVKFPIGFLPSIFSVKNDDISLGLLNFNYKLFVGKRVSGISLPNVLIIDESGLFGDEDMPNMAQILDR